MLYLVVIALTCADNKLNEVVDTEELIPNVYGNNDDAPEAHDTVIRYSGASESSEEQGRQLIHENIVEYDGEQGRQFHFNTEPQEQKSDFDSYIRDKTVEEKDHEEIHHDQITEVDGGKKDLDNQQSYYSYIMQSIVDPVLNEFEKGIKKQTKGENENLIINNALNQTNLSLQSHLPQNSTKLEGIDIGIANRTEKKTKFQCQGRNNTNTTLVEKPQVQIVNNTVLLSMLNFDKNESSDCILVMFFAPWCHFCAQTAPNYNALARAFPQLDVVAVDAAQFSNLNARFGTVSVPNILLFHNSKAVVRFNQTDRGFENLATFVKNITGLEPNTTFNVTEEDYIGPLPSNPTEDADYLLWVAWVFVIICSSFMFVQSTYGQHWINRVKILWQEHQHID